MGGTPSEYYLSLIESNMFETAPEMSCALFKKGRALLPSCLSDIFFFPQDGRELLKMKN